MRNEQSRARRGGECAGAAESLDGTGGFAAAHPGQGRARATKQIATNCAGASAWARGCSGTVGFDRDVSQQALFAQHPMGQAFTIGARASMHELAETGRAAMTIVIASTSAITILAGITLIL